MLLQAPPNLPPAPLPVPPLALPSPPLAPPLHPSPLGAKAELDLDLNLDYLSHGTGIPEASLWLTAEGRQETECVVASWSLLFFLLLAVTFN